MKAPKSCSPQRATRRDLNRYLVVSEKSEKAFNSNGTSQMTREARIEAVERNRPHCPNCNMRMIFTRPGANAFECLRCGYAGPAPHQIAAE
jgi:predicted RNA-binding Zn-ribbon protein involved in translation (DUF1610 family)